MDARTVEAHLDLGALAAGPRGHPAVAGPRRGGEEQLGHHTVAGECFAGRLGALGQEQPGPLPHRALGELAGRLHPG